MFLCSKNNYHCIISIKSKINKIATMEAMHKDPVQLSKGINVRELLTSETEFHIDMDFKKDCSQILMNNEDELYPDMDEDSDSEDVLRNIEESTDKLMLSSPGYHSFEQLASKMVDCLPSGDAKILIIEEGDGPLVPVDAEVKIHYAAYWERARIPFDSTLTMNTGEPMRIHLGLGRILPGLEIGLTTVKGPTARFHLLLQPAVTWGKKGVPPRIQPEPALFVVCLYDVRDTQAALRFNDLPMEDQAKFEVTMKTVKSLHTQAKDLFKKKKYQKAIKNYQQSMSVLSLSKPKSDEEREQIKKFKVNVYTNLAVCYYKINKPKYVINMCENLDFIIDIDRHCKALFYYARAYEMLGKMEDAIAYYRKALKLEPNNKDIGKALADLDVFNKKSAENEKELWKKAFKNDAVEKKTFDVDEVFQKSARDMCQNLAGRTEFAKFELPLGLNKGDIDFLKDLVTGYDKLTLDEDGEGKRKRFTIVKKS